MTAIKEHRADVEVAKAPAMADYIDRLITVEMRNRAMPNGTIAPLYEAARAEGGGEPLTYRAAAGLIKHVRQRDNVFIVTGAGSGALIPLWKPANIVDEVAMQGQEKIGKARLIGYGIGLLAVIAVAAWKFILR